MATSSATDLFETIAAEAAAESPLWGEQLRAEREREGVFAPLAPERFALGLETIYEGYLLHYGRPRLFSPADGDVALLLGDYLYAHGLVRIAATGEVDAVATLAELISTCAHLRAEEAEGDGEAWVDAVRRLGGEPDDAAVAARTGDSRGRGWLSSRRDRLAACERRRRGAQRDPRHARHGPDLRRRDRDRRDLGALRHRRRGY